MSIPEAKICENCGTEKAFACAALTDSDSIVIAHRFVCEFCAAAMFAINVKQVTREEKLQNAVDRVKARSSANERVADDSRAMEDIIDELTR